MSRYYQHLDVDQAKRQDEILHYMKAQGVSKAAIDRQKKRFGLVDQIGSDTVLIVLFDNILAVDFISRHALIWSFQSTVDGYQELIGLDYSRVQIIFDIERIKKKKRRDLFWRLQQIEIGAKAAFDLMLHRERKKANAKQS